MTKMPTLKRQRPITLLGHVLLVVVAVEDRPVRLVRVVIARDGQVDRNGQVGGPLSFGGRRRRVGRRARRGGSGRWRVVARRWLAIVVVRFELHVVIVVVPVHLAVRAAPTVRAAEADAETQRPGAARAKKMRLA